MEGEEKNKAIRDEVFQEKRAEGFRETSWAGGKHLLGGLFVSLQAQRMDRQEMG